MKLFFPFALAASFCATPTMAAPVQQTHIWVEAEDATHHNFLPGFSVMAGAGQSGASGGMYLSLRRDDSPELKTRLPFFAEYSVNVPRDGVYHLWLGASPQDQAWASPLWLRIDKGDFQQLSGAWQSASWGDTTRGMNYFAWLKGGAFPMKKGRHTLHFEVRAPRSSDKLWAAFLDAFFLTTDAQFRPSDNRPQISPQKTYEEATATASPDAYAASLQEKLYARSMALTEEHLSAQNSARVLRLLRQRALPPSTARKPSPQVFGVHAMFPPFVVAGQDSEKIARAYELMARAGVDSFRTVSGTWHHLGENFDDFKQLDFQFQSASRYGMTQGLTVGYPPAAFTRAGDSVLSAARPEQETRYREYLRALFGHIKNRPVDYLELGNEVDAPATWWRASSVQDYVNELRWLREERDRAGLRIPIAAFSATYARSEDLGGKDGGRRFIQEALRLGANRYADEYSVHYTWPLGERDFPAFMRRASRAASGVEKPIFNSEEASYGPPSDVVKCFARNFFLYDMKRVDYYMSRDWFENEVLISSGLFDRDWNPKLRLLPFALSADAMKNRRLVGIATPAPHVEAYVLKKIGAPSSPHKKGAAPRNFRDCEYSIVMWKNASPLRESLSPDPSRGALSPTKIGGVKKVRAAFAWDLSAISFDTKAPRFSVAQPMAVFCDALPVWKLQTPQAFLKSIGNTRSGQVLLPQ